MAPSPSSDTPRTEGYAMPAEWAAHSATWLSWPHNHEDWPGRFPVIPAVFVRVVAELSRVERVRLIVRDGEMEGAVRKLLAEGGASLEAIDFFRLPTDRSWTRDFVPLFVRRARDGAIGAVKFRFDGWARYDNHHLDEAAGQSVAGFLGIPSWEPAAPDGDTLRRVVLEGGAIDVDGDGTLLASEACLVSGPHGRNAWLGKEGTERVLSDYLGIDRVLWVGDGVAGDDTSGHVDDFVRFVAPGRVLLAEERNGADANHRALEQTREVLEGALDARGRKLDILRLPMPAPVLWGDERLPASYANYYVANDLVLVPTFDDPNDAQALGCLGELFPTRRVVGVGARDLVLGLGTVHCSTHEEPLA